MFELIFFAFDFNYIKDPNRKLFIYVNLLNIMEKLRIVSSLLVVSILVKSIQNILHAISPKWYTVQHALIDSIGCRIDFLSYSKHVKVYEYSHTS